MWLLVLLSPWIRPSVPGLTDVVDLSVGADFACVVRADDSVWCWGDGMQHHLGQDDEISSTVPLRVPDLDGARQVAAGENVSCAVLRSGEAWCWGGYREIPDDPDGMAWPTQRKRVRVATAVTGMRGVSAGYGLVAFYDAAGELSVSQEYNGLMPLDGLWQDDESVKPFLHPVEITSSSMGFCVRSAEGRVQCSSTVSEESGSGGGDGDVLAPVTWSKELAERLSAKTDEGDRYPVLDPCREIEPRPSFCTTRLEGARDIDAYDTTTCAALADGRLACWGCYGCSDEDPDLGIPKDGVASLPVIVEGIDRVTQVAVGHDRICVLQTSGEVRCRHDASGFKRVSGLGDVVRIEAGGRAACALRRDGTVACWGWPLGVPDIETVRLADLEVRERPAPAAPPGRMRDHVCRDYDVLVRREQLTQTDYRYDRKGRVALETKTTLLDEGEEHIDQWRYTYDRKGRLATEKGKDTVDDARYRYTYDRFDRVVSRRGSGPWDSTATSWTRTPETDGGWTDIGDGGATMERIRYDAEGRERWRRSIGDSSTDTTTEYDADGRVVKEIELEYHDVFFDFPIAKSERVFTYDGERKIRTEERTFEDGKWLPWRTTLHFYTGC